LKMIDNPPRWTYELPLNAFKKLSENSIKEIRLNHNMTSEDTWDTYVEVKIDEEWVAVPLQAWELFKFNPRHHSSLLELTNHGKNALKLADEIKKFNTKYRSELATYKRLKAKFEGN
jgi:hypothetical protein